LADLRQQSTALEKAKDRVAGEISGLLLGARKGISPSGHTASISVVNRKAYAVEASSYDRLNLTIRVQA
jgi:hypothetical protein